MTAPAPAARRGGRPRDPSRDDAILDAVVTVLAEDGLGACSMDAIAAVARAGKATVYRRWSTRSELIAETLVRRAPEVIWDEPRHQPLRADLQALVFAFACSDRAQAAMAVLSELPHDGRLRDAHDVGPRAALTAASQELVDRAHARGQAFNRVWALDISDLIAVMQIDTMTMGRPLSQPERRSHVHGLLTRLGVGADA